MLFTRVPLPWSMQCTAPRRSPQEQSLHPSTRPRPPARLAVHTIVRCNATAIPYPLKAQITHHDARRARCRPLPPLRSLRFFLLLLPLLLPSLCDSGYFGRHAEAVDEATLWLAPGSVSREQLLCQHKSHPIPSTYVIGKQKGV